MENDIILSYNDVVLRRSDLEISGEVFLNDTIIQFYFSYLQSDCSSEDVLLLPPSISFFIMNCLHSENLKKIIEPLKLREKKVVIFAINNNTNVEAEGGSHWSLLVYEKNSEAFIHHDSMGTSNMTYADKLYRAVVGFVGECESHSSQISLLEYPCTPQQKNSFDCGLYVTAFAKVICDWYKKGCSRGLWYSEVMKLTPEMVSQIRNDIPMLIQELAAKKEGATPGDENIRNLEPNLKKVEKEHEEVVSCELSVSLKENEEVLVLCRLLVVGNESRIREEKEVSSSCSDAQPTADQLKAEIQRLEKQIKELESPLYLSTSPARSQETSSASTRDMKEFLHNNKRVFLFGGYDGTDWLSTVDCYSPLSDTKERLRPMNFARSYGAAAAVSDDIYIFGGGDGTSFRKTVELYNVERNEWTPCPSLSDIKGCLSGVTLHDKIYALGGGDGINCFSDVETFDPAAWKWIPAQSMQEKRSSGAAAELKGTIYAAGGCNGKEYLRSVERFDPREGSWTRISSMHFQRGGHSLVAMNEKLYAIGGYDGQNMVLTIEEYDCRRNSWIKSKETMMEPRMYATAGVIGESIFVISGLKTIETLTETVECYKEGGGWSIVNPKGAGKRCFSTSIFM